MPCLTHGHKEYNGNQILAALLLLTPSVGAGVVTRAFLTRIFTDSRRYPPDTTGADIVRTVDMLAQHDTGPHVTSRQSCRDGRKLRTWSLGL